MNIRQLLDEGIKKRVENDARREASLPPAFRFGNAGAIIDGVTYGDCPRLAHLRLLGYQPTEGRHTQIMFSSGRAMEEIIYDFLSSAVPPERIKREEEAAVRYTHSSGVPVTGRPDFILLDEEGRYVTGIESKGKLSFWGVKNLLIEKKPESSHLIQAAHYMWKHSLESYALVYVSPTNYVIPNDDKNDWPKGAIKRSGAGWCTSPDMFVIQLWTAKDGTLAGEMHDRTPFKTSLRLEHIEAFYAEAARMKSGEPLPAVPSSKSLVGKASYKKCQYCPLKEVCDEHTAYEPWLDAAIDAITLTWQEHWPELLEQYLDGWQAEPADAGASGAEEEV